MQREFKKDFASLDGVFAFMDEGLSDAPPEAVYALRLAVEELFTNMVKYGKGSSDDISISIDTERNCMTVRLVDHDVDFFDPKPSGELDETTPLGDMKIGGLGLHLVKHLLDDVRYSYVDRCSTITIVKKLEH